MDAAKREVLRYLGHRRQEITPELDTLIDACMAEMRATAKPLWSWQLFDTLPEANAIQLPGAGLTLTGADIHRHLKDSLLTAVMAVTLGVGADNLIRRTEHTDLTRSLILDACATQLVEECCDRAEEEIKADARSRGLATNFRYSPGYGDLPLMVQPGILQALNAGRRLGLTCTDSLILLPRKSVTALVGLLPPGTFNIEKKRSCDTCSLRETCTVRKDGDGCGYQSMDN